MIEIFAYYPDGIAAVIRKYLCNLPKLKGAPPLGLQASADPGLRKFGFRASGEVGAVLLGQVVAMFAAVVGTGLLSRVTSPTDLGRVALALTAVQFSGTLVIGPLGGALLRFTAANKHDNKVAISRAILLKISGWSALGLALISVGVLAVSWLYFSPDEIRLVALACGLNIASAQNSLFLSYSSGLRQRVFGAVCQSADQCIKYPLAVLFIHQYSSGSVSVLGAFVVSSLVVTAVQWGFFWRHHVDSASILSRAEFTNEVERQTRRHLAYAWPMCVWGLPAWLPMAADRWALQIFVSPDQVGIYSILYQFGYVPVSALMTGVVGQLVGPIVFQFAGDGTDRSRNERARANIDKLTYVLLALSAFAAATTAFLYPILLPYILKGTYLENGELVPLFILSAGLFGCGQILANVPMLQHDTRSLLAPKIWTGGGAVLFYIIGAKASGAEGVALGSCCFSAIYLIWIYLITRSSTH